MGNKNNGGPAFPVSTNEDIEGTCGHQDGPNTWQYPGITTRDYFAAKAMQSLMFLPEYVNDWPADIAARDAYQFADAMIAARNN